MPIDVEAVTLSADGADGLPSDRFESSIRPKEDDVRLVAIDLEGTGSQDGDEEALLEIALVPLDAELAPDMPRAFSTLFNPERSIPNRPWISPGITNASVRNAPFLRQQSTAIARLVDGTHLLGHNIVVDWRLLSKKLPGLRPTGLLDTLRLARAHRGKAGNSLTALVDEYGLTSAVAARVPYGQPHRALWDAVACALLLDQLRTRMGLSDFTQLTAAAAAKFPSTAPPPGGPVQPGLFD